ncbi:hypothetical protein REPUB_Repub18cG0026600 [Reevesia pubescens]
MPLKRLGTGNKARFCIGLDDGKYGNHLCRMGFSGMGRDLFATSALDAQAERIVHETIAKASVGRTTIIIAHRLSTIRNVNLIVVLQAGRVIELGSHDELMQMKGGEYNRMIELQKMALQNEASDDSNYDTEGRNRARILVAQSPPSYRSSAPSTPELNPFSPALSVGTPYSYTIQYDPDDDSVDGNFKQLASPAPSEWRLLKVNAPEWEEP